MNQKKIDDGQKLGWLKPLTVDASLILLNSVLATIYLMGLTLTSILLGVLWDVVLLAVVGLLLVSFLSMFHGAMGDPMVGIAVVVYHYLQISIFFMSLTYFGFYAAKDLPTWGFRLAMSKHVYTDRLPTRYNVMGAALVIIALLILVELVFYFLFGISITGQMIGTIEASGY